MATTDILGLFTSPEQYQQQQDLMMQRQAAELAQLDPYSSIRYGAIRAGQQFGRGLAGILGAEDPQLRMITARQSALQGINLNDPESIFTAARQLADAGDQQGALMLADYGRKAASEVALAQQRSRAERAAATPKELQLSQARAKAKGLIEGTPEYNKFIDEDLVRQTTKEVKPDLTTEIKNASVVAKSEGLKEGTPEFNKRVGQLVTQYTTKADARFGVDREAISEEEFEKPYAQLTKEQKEIVNKRLNDEKDRQAEKGAAKLVLPGEKGGPANIAQFRNDVITTVKPYREAVSAADKALAALDNSIKENNFSSYDVARKQLLKAAGESQISNADVKTVGTDPSIAGGTIDIISKAITSTPSVKTQNQLRDALKIVRKEAVQKARDELSVQRRIASRAGFKEDDIKLVFEFPEFEQRKAGGGAGKSRTVTLKSGKTVTVVED